MQYLQMPYVTNDGNGPDERPCSADASIVPNEKKSCDRMNSEEIRNRYLYNLRCLEDLSKGRHVSSRRWSLQIPHSNLGAYSLLENEHLPAIRLRRGSLGEDLPHVEGDGAEAGPRRYSYTTRDAPFKDIHGLARKSRDDDEVPRRRAALAPLPSTWRAAGEARLRRYKPKDHGRHLLKQTAPGDSNDLRVSRQGLASCIARGSGAGHAAAAGVPNDGSRISNCKEGLDQAGSGARGTSSSSPHAQPDARAWADPPSPTSLRRSACTEEQSARNDSTTTRPLGFKPRRRSSVRVSCGVADLNEVGELFQVYCQAIAAHTQSDGDVKNEVASSRLVASLAALRMADKLRDTSTHKNNNKNNNIVERRQHFGGLRDCKGGMRGQLLAPAKQAASDDNGVLDFKDFLRTIKPELRANDAVKLEKEVRSWMEAAKCVPRKQTIPNKPRRASLGDMMAREYTHTMMGHSSALKGAREKAGFTDGALAREVLDPECCVLPGKTLDFDASAKTTRSGFPASGVTMKADATSFTRIPTVEHPSTSKEAHPRRRRCASVRVSTGVVDFNEVADIFAEFSAASLSGAGVAGLIAGASRRTKAGLTQTKFPTKIINFKDYLLLLKPELSSNDVDKLAKELNQRRPPAISTQAVQDQCLIDSETQALTDCFIALDVNGSGTLNYMEIKQFLICLGIADDLEDAHEVFCQIDSTGCKEIGLERFLRWWVVNCKGVRVNMDKYTEHKDALETTQIVHDLCRKDRGVGSIGQGALGYRYEGSW
eukprot:CAMPEP_0114292754 /NCGR_PEP_ID=MMETSP0059-20121206/9236_1 /TAXON_ID=36894 /ORGANISM="Pyramimonas parkeae, Strain CCMP726" /LENGTH=767 /DNA_ID=CAMNT_0001414435 /DNA_START=316 /DNA_END=2619 /DNA_ORIENTATION=-